MSLKNELVEYRNTRNKGEKLSKIKETILAVPCNTLENERAFSLLNFLVTKYRSSLNDSTITQLTFLRMKYLEE